MEIDKLGKKNKILVASWAWRPVGGDWTYIENMNKLYESNGYEIIPFSTHNSQNLASGLEFEDYFVNSYDFKVLNNNKNILNGIRAVKSSIVSNDALKKLKLLLDIYDIKIAHLHNIHHYLTPAIISLLKEKRVKIIWTLHDYKILCPENSFVSNGKICEKCLNGSFYNCAINKCKKSSMLASTLATFEAYFYRVKKIYNLVDVFLCPSFFLYKKFIEAGFNSDKLVVSNLCYDISIIDNFIMKKIIKTNVETKPYIIYVGRLEKIKGVETLIKAIKGTNVVIKIIGSGTAENELKSLIDSSDSNIEFVGQMNKDEVFNLTMGSQFVVCPSEWFENFPFSIIESFLFSKPVVGADIGGIPELVINNVTGLLFESGNILQLREKLLSLWNNTSLIEEMGKNAREHAYNLVNFDDHWSKLSRVVNI